MKTEFTECPHCEYPINARDDHQGEVVCEGCGNVSGSGIKYISDEELDKDHDADELNSSERYTEQEQEVIQQTKNRRLKQANIQSWRKRQYAMTVGILNTSLMMSQNQKDRVKFIVNTYSLNLIHSRPNYYYSSRSLQIY
jgi:transcription initiation factor TFIIIB Brf1 subunit/transcription initiation factor TFIIB